MTIYFITPSIIPMKYDKNTKKLTYEMKMPGDAWMGHVDQHHNGASINPLTVESDKGKWSTEMQQRIDSSKQIPSNQNTMDKGNSVTKDQIPQSDISHDHNS